MRTLTFEQMEQSSAGWPDWLVNAWNAVRDFFSDVWDWICDEAWDWVVDHADISVDLENMTINGFGIHGDW